MHKLLARGDVQERLVAEGKWWTPWPRTAPSLPPGQ
jgi:hypothetical protein